MHKRRLQCVSAGAALEALGMEACLLSPYELALDLLLALATCGQLAIFVALFAQQVGVVPEKRRLVQAAIARAAREAAAVVVVLELMVLIRCLPRYTHDIIVDNLGLASQTGGSMLLCKVVRTQKVLAHFVVGAQFAPAHFALEARGVVGLQRHKAQRD